MNSVRLHITMLSGAKRLLLKFYFGRDANEYTLIEESSSLARAMRNML